MHRRSLNRSRSLAVVTSVVLIALMSMLSPAGALANNYTGLLNGGTASASASGNAYGANSVVRQQSWSAPSGVQLGGFAYTSASFNAANADATGGLSAGFKGSGGSAPTDLNFPSTTDCSISEATPRIWVTSGGQVANVITGPHGLAPGACNTTGNTSGWNYANAEVESNNTAIDPQTSYQTLTLSIWCARDANCNGGDAANYSVTNLSALFDDSYNQPAGSLSWTQTIDGSKWYQTNTGNLNLEASASDPAGVCSMGATLSGPSTISSALGNENPALITMGSPINEEFEYGTNPCWTGSVDTASWTLPPGMTAGAYSPSLQASNPGNYQSQGFAGSGSPTVAGAGSVNIDDTTPQVSWNNPESGWTSQTSEMLDVTVGPSGLSSLGCTDNGNAITPVLSSGSTNGAGTTAWTIPTSVTGANAVGCTAFNGDANGSLSASASSTFDVDAVVPTIAFQDAGYTSGAWTNRSQTVIVVPTVGPSGLRSVACTLDGAPANLDGSDAVAVGGNSANSNQPHVLSCYVTSETGETDQSDPGTFDVAIDTDIPTLTFSGAASDGTWASGTPTIVVTGGEQNTTTGQNEILSGISSISCTVNGASVPTPPLTPGYATSFELTTNGANSISCVPTTAAGTGRAFTETVNVDNPANDCAGSRCHLTGYGSSPLIDDGADPYSNGPSQTTWYRTAQPITVTANLPSGQAPVASISCTGAMSGTWPLSNLDTDSAGGEEITVDVPPPGGQLSCTAEDAASNVYQLGSYQFEEDNTAPSGQFDQLSASTPDDIQLSVDDPGGSLASGVGYVHVYATNTSSGAVYDLGLAHLVSGRSADVYDVNLDDADAPSGTYKFDAEVGDIAGNTADLTAGPNGSTTVWELPLRDNTELTMTADGVSGTVDSAVPGGLQPDVPNTSTDMAGVGSTLKLVAVHGSIRGRAARAQFARAAAARAAAAKSGNCRPSVKARKGKRSTACKRASAAAVVTVSYGKKLMISGTLHDLKARHSSIAGATIDVWGQVAGSKPSLIGHTKTNAKGAYRFTARGGASRNVYATYAGTRKLRTAVTQIRERFTGRVTLIANQAAAGKSLALAGRVIGGHVPAHGLNVTVEGKIVGYPGSQQLGTVHTNARGAYRYSIRLPSATRGLTYRLWLVVQSRLNPGWPYLGARSQTLSRKVS
jgi:hypothetical protein